MDANKLRFGHKVLVDGQPCVVVMATLRQQPRLASKMITKMKNLLTGSVVERTFTGSDKVEEADITTTPAKYLYNDGSTFYFMDSETFEQFEFGADKVGDNKDFLIEDTDVYIMRFNGNPVDIDLPPTVTMEVIETEPGVRGDTAQGGSKPAKFKTGLTINVPLFVNQGDKVVINTEMREYRERVTKNF